MLRDPGFYTGVVALIYLAVIVYTGRFDLLDQWQFLYQ